MRVVFLLIVILSLFGCGHDATVHVGDGAKGVVRVSIDKANGVADKETGYVNDTEKVAYGNP